MAPRSIVSGGGWLRVYAACQPVSLRSSASRTRAAAQACFRLGRSPATDVRGGRGAVPGRQDRYAEEFVTDMGTLADAIASAAASLPSCPTAFFGHSLGATIAFEWPFRLQPRFPTPLAHLFRVARKAPRPASQ